MDSGVYRGCNSYLHILSHPYSRTPKSCLDPIHFEFRLLCHIQLPIYLYIPIVSGCLNQISFNLSILALKGAWKRRFSWPTRIPPSLLLRDPSGSFWIRPRCKGEYVFCPLVKGAIPWSYPGVVERWTLNICWSVRAFHQLIRCHEIVVDKQIELLQLKCWRNCDYKKL